MCYIQTHPNIVTRIPLFCNEKAPAHMRMSCTLRLLFDNEIHSCRIKRRTLSMWITRRHISYGWFWSLNMKRCFLGPVTEVVYMCWRYQRRRRCYQSLFHRLPHAYRAYRASRGRTGCCWLRVVRLGEFRSIRSLRRNSQVSHCRYEFVLSTRVSMTYVMIKASPPYLDFLRVMCVSAYIHCEISCRKRRQITTITLRFIPLRECGISAWSNQLCTLNRARCVR